MTVLFQCPKCQANLKAPSDKIGARSRCNRCANPVVVPDPDAPPVIAPKPIETPQPVSQGIPAEPDEEWEGPPTTDYAGQTFPVNRSFMRIFWFIDAVLDVRFKRYLTPYIIRTAWILLLFCCIGGFFLSRFAMPVIEALEERAIRASLRHRLDSPPTYERRSFERRVEPNPVADWFAGTILYVLSAVMTLMAARVAGETIIVVFNISTDLKAVKRYLNSVP